MTTKLSWGKRIAILYLGFVALIIILVTGSMRQSFDLVSKDYYAQEIAYQNTIDAGKNQAALSAPVGVIADGQSILISFPPEFEHKILNADLHFYSPVSAALDKTFSLSSENSRLTIARTDLAKANYKLKISWESEGKTYYQETDINLSK